MSTFHNKKEWLDKKMCQLKSKGPMSIEVITDGDTESITIMPGDTFKLLEYVYKPGNADVPSVIIDWTKPEMKIQLYSMHYQIKNKKESQTVHV